MEDNQAVDQEVIHCILGVLIDLFNLCSMQVLPDGEWDCKFCGDKLKNKENNRVHIQQFCAERPDWEHSCVFCGLEFESESGLRVHTSRWCEEK